MLFLLNHLSVSFVSLYIVPFRITVAARLRSLPPDGGSIIAPGIRRTHFCRLFSDVDCRFGLYKIRHAGVDYEPMKAHRKNSFEMMRRL